MTPTDVKFSVLMPTFNRPRHLRRAVEAVLSQEHTNFELIIKDGGDCGKLTIPDDDRIVYLHSRDRGITHAMNIAARVATGDIWHWANDDDLMEPGALRHVAQRFAQPEVRWMYGRAQVIDEDDGPMFVIGGEPYSHKAQLEKNLCPQPTVYWRRSLFEEAGAEWDESCDLASDYEMWLRFGLLAEPLVDHTVLASYRLHDEAIGVRRVDDADSAAARARGKHSW